MGIVLNMIGLAVIFVLIGVGLNVACKKFFNEKKEENKNE